MRTATALLPVAAAVLLAGCASSKGEGYVVPGFDVNSVNRLAVVSGKNSDFATDSEKALLDIFQMEFLRRGWNVVDRSNIDRAIDELQFQNSDFTSPTDRGALGNIINADALVVVNFAMIESDVSMTAKMFKTQSGDMIWMGSGDGSLRKGLSTITGALVGAGVGAAAGSSGKHTAIGGVLGGAIGYTLGPTELENAKDVVKAVCETLPVRMG